MLKSLALRAVDLERLDRALTTILSPLATRALRRLAFSSRIVGRGIARRRSRRVRVAACRGPDAHPFDQRGGAATARDPDDFRATADLPTDPWLHAAERERLRSGAEVWSRLRAFWRATAGQPVALRRSAFLGEVLTPGRMYDSENIDWSVTGGHVALCVSYGNAETSVRSRRTSPRPAAGTLLKLLLPALKVGVTMRLAHDREVAAELSLARFGLTRREAQIARLLARRATNSEIAEQLDVSRHTVRHHVENIFAKLGVHSRRSIAAQFEWPES